MDTKSPRCLATSNGRPHPLFIEGGPKLAVTLKTHENRVFADCPLHRDRTVRHSKPTDRTAMIMCQSRSLEPRADCPHPWGGPSAVQNFEPTDLQTSLTKSGSDRRTVRSPGGGPSAFQKVNTHRNRSVSVPEISVGGGPSAHKDRTVRSSFWTPKTELPSFCARFSFSRRTVRPHGPDDPQFILDHQQSQKQFCSSSSEITADRPPPLSGPSAGIFPAEMYLGKTAITLSSDVQIR